MRYLILFLVSLFANHIFSQEAKRESSVYDPINAFIEGTTYNYPEKIIESFLPGGKMYLHNTADTLMIWPVEKYAELYERRESGQRNQRFTKLIALDVVEDVAYAKLEVDIPSFNMRFFDLLLLKKIDDSWKIISKCTDAIPLPVSENKNEPNPVKTNILEGLRKPWSMAFISENEVLIAEKDGGLIQANLSDGSKKTIGNLPDDIAREVYIDTSKYTFGTFPPGAHGSSQTYNAGLFQILLHPLFEQNQTIYLSYAAENQEKKSALKVIRAKLENDKLIQQQTILLAGPYTHGLFHYGGGMVIGRDNKLYIATGERNLYEKNNPPLPLSQDISDPRGKILRFNLDGSIPKDNPTYPENAFRGLYASGIRATQGFAIHPETGKIWFSEHGTIQGDEVNLLKAGANYGWPYVTSGTYRTSDYQPEVPKDITFEAPIYFWDQTVAPTGLTFYTGNAFPQWQGDLIVPGLSKGNLWRLALDGETVIGAEALFLDDPVRLRKAILSPGGILYVLTDEENGQLIRIDQK